MPSDDRPFYFPFQPNRFTSDSNVEAMTTEGVGAYILLLCKAWFETPPASIPDDDETLARWARLSPDAWQRNRAAVLKAWTKKAGRYHQKRLALTYHSVTEKSARAVRAGKAGAETRWKKNQKMLLKQEEVSGVALGTSMRSLQRNDNQLKLNTKRKKKEEPRWSESLLPIRDFLETQKLLPIPHLDIPESFSLFDAEYWEALQKVTGVYITGEMLGVEFAKAAMWMKDNPARKIQPRGWRQFIKNWFIHAAKEYGTGRNGAYATGQRGGPRRIATREGFQTEVDEIKKRGPGRGISGDE